MFVRAKNIKGKKYAYLVKNSWKKGKVRQQVKKYLGPIISCPKKIKEISLEVDFSNKTKQCVREIISKEFLSRGFVQKQARLISGDLVINFSTNKITNNNSECVLEINDRYLCGGMLDDLQNFFAPESSEDRPGKKLAQIFSDAGISISQNDFIKLYRKIYT